MAGSNPERHPETQRPRRLLVLVRLGLFPSPLVLSLGLLCVVSVTLSPVANAADNSSSYTNNGGAASSPSAGASAGGASPAAGTKAKAAATSQGGTNRQPRQTGQRISPREKRHPELKTEARANIQRKP